MAKKHARHRRSCWKKFVAAGFIAWVAYPAETKAFFPPIFNPPPNEPQFGPPPEMPTEPPEVPEIPETPENPEVPVIPPIPPVIPEVPVVPPIPPVIPEVPMVPPIPPIPPETPPATTPEPATIISGLLGLAALGGYGYRRRNRPEPK